MIVGFIGFQRVGKTTASNYLIEKYGFVRHNMKDALVAEIKQNFPDLLQQLANEENITIDQLFEMKPPLMRALLQNYGTEVRRRDNDNYWVEQWAKKLTTKDTVVDDVRFLNEAQMVRNYHGILIRLTRPDITTGGEHKSETEQLEIEADYTIECKPGEHEALYKQLDEIVNSVV